MSTNYKKRKQAAHTKKKSPRNMPKQESKAWKFIEEWLWLITIAALAIIVASFIIFIPMCDESCTANADKISTWWHGLTSCGAEPEDSADIDTEVSLDDVTQLQKPAEGETVAVLDTSKGIIKIRLFPEAAPKSVENFTGLIEQGYYDNIIFHRVINDFMIQSGSPDGSPAGGESLWGGYFEDEFNNGLYNFRGALSMANTGAEATNSSQFFIVQAPDCQVEKMQLTASGMPEWAASVYGQIGGYPVGDHCLTPVTNYLGHTVFGQVFEGMDVVDAIAAVATDENDRPTEDVIINRAYLETYGSVSTADAE